jgi:hypothetical protein
MTATSSRSPSTRMATSLLALGISATLPGGAQAARLDYTIGARLLHSDNITLVETNERSEEILAPQLQFDFTHDSSNLAVNVGGTLQYLYFRNNTYDNDTRGDITGDLLWTLSPERLTFTVRNRLSQESVSALDAFTTDNQQTINVFEAGPNFIARFNSRTRGELSLRYTDNWAEESETFNSNRYHATASVQRQINDTDSLSLNVVGARTEYDTVSEFYNYKRYDAYITYRSVLSHLDLNVDAGYTRLEPRSSKALSGALFRGQLDWELAPRSTLGIAAGYTYDDASQYLIQGVGSSGDIGLPVITDPNNPNLQIIPDTFRRSTANLEYQFAGDRLHVQAMPYYERVRYTQNEDFDSNYHGAAVNVRFAVQPQTFFLFSAQQYTRDFIVVDQHDKVRTIGLGIAKQFSPHWAAQFDYRHRRSEGSLANLNYRENLLMFSIAYSR